MFTYRMKEFMCCVRMTSARIEGAPMIETLAAIDAPHFYAGIVLLDDAVTEAAPIVKYMRKWDRKRVREYCQGKGWTVTVVHRIERARR
jgi:hypothetical protein